MAIAPASSTHSNLFEEILRENAHPPGWQNPRPEGRYDLVVIGAGTAGLVATAGAAALGARVAIIERHLMGGDCLNYGCVPSKALIRASRAAHEAQDAAEFGVVNGRPRVDFAAVMRRMQRLRAQISDHDSAQRFTRLGADVFLGQARFVAPDAVEVDGQRLRFRKAIIATGARAAMLPVTGLAEAKPLTNETVFSLTELPRRLIVIGAGPIGCELAQAFRRFGSEVSIVSLDARLLPREAADAASVLAQQFEREGIRTFLGASIHSVESGAAGHALFFERGQELEMVEGDQILVAVGRTPNVDGLELEAARVKYDRKGVRVDDRLRTSNPCIHAAGDICSPYKFTHAAEAMARIALQNALFFGRRKASELIIPWCTYTDPEIAHVGLYDHEARAKGFAVKTHTVPLAEIDRALLDGDHDGFGRVHVDARTGRILGATLVSRHAGESIGEMVLALQQRLRLTHFSSVIHPYPTQAEVFKRLGDAAMKERLRPWMRPLLQKYFAVFR